MNISFKLNNADFPPLFNAALVKSVIHMFVFSKTCEHHSKPCLFFSIFNVFNVLNFFSHKYHIS